MILLVIKVRQNVKLLMLSAFTLKIHIKSPSKIQTRSQTCKQFKKGVAVTVAEHRCKVDRKNSKNREQVFLLPRKFPFGRASSSPVVRALSHGEGIDLNLHH